MLRTNDDELRDLAAAPLLDAETGLATGVTLDRWLGAGGMSTVFLADVAAERSSSIADLCPSRAVVKFTKISTAAHLARLHLSVGDIFRKELVALGRVMTRRPPTDLIIGLFGAGSVDVEHHGAVHRLAWLLLEHVDGGPDGTTLAERVQRARDGMDPPRVARLARGFLDGTAILHEVGVIHRDLKPDNIFLAGPIDDETPKIADCGIARVEGATMGTIAALTPAYGGPEQALSIVAPTQSNPLVGPWTDVHALAAIAWFTIAGEEWCRSDADRAWHAGERRSLRTGTRSHPGFVAKPALLDELSRVLARGAAPRLPAIAWEGPGREPYLAYANARFGKSMTEGPERYASVADLGRELLPLLEEAAGDWTSRSARENRAATAYRQTRMLGTGDAGEGESLAEIRALPPISLPKGITLTKPLVSRGALVTQDAKALLVIEDQLVFVIESRGHRVDVPPELASLVAQSRHVTRGPGGGYALVGPSHVLLLRGGEFRSLPLPSRSGGAEVGAIVGVLGDGHGFGLVTAETDDGDGGPELWPVSAGGDYGPPVVLPIGGDVLALSDGPYGTLAVGSRANKRGRALSLALDGNVTVFTTGVNDGPPLSACVAGAMRESWAAGPGVVVRFDRAGASPEAVESTSPPVGMKLDPVGVPWLVTTREVLRRHGGPDPTWRVLHRAGEDDFVALGLCAAGARVIESRGGGALVVPSDAGEWGAGSTT